MRCPACGFDNPDAMRFCGNGGTVLPGAPATRFEERKVVTVLFADLVGSTAYAERTDPERVRAVIRRYFDAMAEAITRHGGTVEKYIGDAVMGIFGLPASHEDDPERAVRAALAIQAHAAALIDGLQVRQGVATGEVMADPAAAQAGEFLVTGDPVNVAARLQQAAEPGAILLDARTMRRVQGAIEVTPAGALHLQGKEVPVRAWRALQAAADRR